MFFFPIYKTHYILLLIYIYIIICGIYLAFFSCNLNASFRNVLVLLLENKTLKTLIKKDFFLSFPTYQSINQNVFIEHFQIQSGHKMLYTKTINEYI